jgi:putative transposase
VVAVVRGASPGRVSAGSSGVRLHIANRWYPSSTTCSGCAVVKTKLRLSERTYTCGQCGLNAARNLAALLGEVIGATSTPSCGATVNEPDGNPRQTHTVWAAGTATGRPTRPTPHRKATATRTERTHIRSQFS